ncbi:MAG: hypothetical protein Kow00127_15830 [Bacteroidales bacterium]
MRRLAIILFSVLPALILAQGVSQLPESSESEKVIGQIYSAFRYDFRKDVSQKAAFEFNQGIIGYRHAFGEKVSGIILYDVTRTTHVYSLTTADGEPVSIDYFEGSKYTAYLKMAEIKWNPGKVVGFRFGQLLNTQYLTFQDRFWGYRYIDVTFQEKFRLGMPADFGAQVDLQPTEYLLVQLSAVNGEGPFRHQDEYGGMLYSANIQYEAVPGLTFKLYSDLAPAPDTGNASNRSVITGFAGFKNKNFSVGGEYTYLSNRLYITDSDYYGFSVFGGVRVLEKTDLILRWDRLTRSLGNESSDTDYFIAGVQYQPEKMLNMALTYRYFSEGDIPMLYFSMGLKF